MVQRKTVTAITIVAALMMAGCLAAEDATPEAQTGPGEISADEDTGTIVGFVLDESLEPVAGVEVAVLDQELSTRSDDTGAFKLEGLAPGSYTVAVQKLGYESAVKNVAVGAGETVEIQFSLRQVAVLSAPYSELLIGDGYFSCGAYLIVVTWGNLHACVWDEHKPRFNFEFSKEGHMGIRQEVTWEQNTGITSKMLRAFIDYKAVCDPFCDSEDSWGSSPSDNPPQENPFRQYYDVEGDLDDKDEDPVPLASMTFPGGEPPSTSPPSAGSGPVLVFQQRMTHYITLFYVEHGDLNASAIPDV